MHPKKNGKFFLIDPLKRAKSQKLGRNVALPIISGTEQIKEYHPTKIIIDLQKEYEEDKELLDLLDNKRNYYLPYSIESKKENNEQNCTGNISNRKKPLCEIIPEEDEDKQKITKLMEKLKGLDLDWGSIKDQAQDWADQLQSQLSDKNLGQKIADFFAKLWEAICSLFS